MAKKLYEESSIQDIASAIRAKNGSSDTYTISEMSTAIEAIPSGGGGENKYIMGLTMDLYKGSAMTIEAGFKIQAIWNEQTQDIAFQLCGKADISSYKKLIVTGKTGDSYYHKYGEHDVRKIYIGTCDTPSNATFVPTSITWNEDPFIFTEAFSSFRAVIELGHSHDYLYFSANGWNIEDLTFAVVEDGYSVYKYHWSNDGKICVREEVGAVKWFFIGLTKDDNDIEVPTELVSYLPDFEAPGQYMHAIAFTDPEDAWDGSHYIGFVYPGTANVKIRSWYSTSLGGGTFWGVLDITHYPFIGQQNEYVDPLDIPDIDTSLIEKTITENGTYSAEDDGYVGYLNVDVNVEGGGGLSRIIDMNNVDASVQGSMKYVGCLDSISTLYSTGDAIGCSIHCTDAIDVTNADKIVFRLKTGPCYGHNNANVEQQTTERFKALVGIVSSWTGITYLVDAASSLLASKKFDYTNTVYTSTDCYLDVSSITGDVYIGIDAHGWNATFEEIRLE